MTKEVKRGYLTGSELIGNKSSLNIFEMDLKDFKIPQPPSKDQN